MEWIIAVFVLLQKISGCHPVLLRQAMHRSYGFLGAIYCFLDLSTTHLSDVTIVLFTVEKLIENWP